LQFGLQVIKKYQEWREKWEVFVIKILFSPNQIFCTLYIGLKILQIKYEEEILKK
jgi:hypothetical protein